MNNASIIRKAWMTIKGFDREEVNSCDGDFDFDEEMENLRAALELNEITPPASVLEEWAKGVGR